jgi:hypothetical protein
MKEIPFTGIDGIKGHYPRILAVGSLFTKDPLPGFVLGRSYLPK